MRTLFTGIFSLFMFLGTVSPVQAFEATACCEMSCADDEIKKKKKKGKKIGGSKGKKKKKGFFSKVFGSK